MDEFTSRLLDIHSKMIDMNKKEVSCVGFSLDDKLELQFLVWDLINL